MADKSCFCLLFDESRSLSVRNFMRTAVDWLESINVCPEKIEISGPEFSIRVGSYKRALPKLADERMEKAESGCIINLKPGSTSLQDTIIDVSFNTQSKKCLIMLHESVRVMQTDEWVILAQKLHQSVTFDYGYIYSMDERLGPGHYPSGIQYHIFGEPVIDPVGDLMRTRWAHTYLNRVGNPASRIIRQVYLLQFLSDTHLSRPIRVMRPSASGLKIHQNTAL